MGWIEYDWLAGVRGGKCSVSGIANYLLRGSLMMDGAQQRDRVRDSYAFANTLQFLHLFWEALGLEPMTPFVILTIGP
jgi:hypothetical protein